MLPDSINEDLEFEKAVLRELAQQPHPLDDGTQLGSASAIDVPSIASVPLSESSRSSGPLRPTMEGQQRYIDAPTTEEAYKELPSTAVPGSVSQRPMQSEMAPIQKEKPFDWARALTALGGGDVGAIDANRRYADQSGMRDLEMQGKRAELADRELQRKQARSLMDPNSEASKAAAQDYAQYLYNLAEAPGIGKLADEFRNQAWQSQGKSALEIQRMKASTDSLYGNIIKAVSTQNNADLAGQKMSIQERQAEAAERANAERMGLSWAEYQERVRHNMVEEERKDGKVSLPPQQVVQKQNARSVSLKEIARIKELMNSGKIRYTGKGANWMNSIFSVIPGKADLRTKEERELAGLIKRLRAPERKNIYGAALSKFDIMDSGQFMADIEQNPETMMTNLDTLESALLEENALTQDTYPALVGSTDKLPSSSGNSKAFKGAGQKPLKAPAGAQPGQNVRQKSTGKVFVVQPDGTMTPE